jgi:hypothetical protein
VKVDKVDSVARIHVLVSSSWPISPSSKMKNVGTRLGEGMKETWNECSDLRKMRVPGPLVHIATGRFYPLHTHVYLIIGLFFTASQNTIRVQTSQSTEPNAVLPRI